MKSFFFLFAGIIFFLASSHAGDSSKCIHINDNDKRAMCRALADQNPNECIHINNSDYRSLCRAQSGKNENECIHISNPDMRAQCKALAG